MFPTSFFVHRNFVNNCLINNFFGDKAGFLCGYPEFCCDYRGQGCELLIEQIKIV
jgi:hypothetical protein